MAKKPLLPAVSWALYDAANSAFPLVMTTAVFVLYFKNIVVGGADPGRSDLLWGTTLSLSAALVALTSPFLGAVADMFGAQKRILLGYTAIAVLATLALSFSKAGMVAFAMVAYIIANAGFEGGMAMYGSLLPSVVNHDNMGKWSGIGWATGYIGGLLCLLATMGLATSGQVSAVVRIVAVWFAVLSIPLFTFVPEPPPDLEAAKAPFRVLKSAVLLVFETPGLRLFFVAYLIYNDAIITVFSFAAPFATDVLGFSVKDVIVLVAGVQITGAIGAFAFGILSDRIGHIFTIRLTLVMWIGVTLAAFFTALNLPIWQALSAETTTVVQIEQTAGQGAVTPPPDGATVSPAEPASGAMRLRRQIFWILGLLVGFSMGATQSSSRAFLAVVSPEEISGRLFGLYAVAGRFSAVIGPILFGTISFLTGSKAWSVLSLVVLFGAGLALMMRVHEDTVRNFLQRRDPKTSLPG